MRISILTSDFPPKPGGISNYVFNLSLALMKKGHKVTVISRGFMKNYQVENIEGLSVYRVPFIPIYPLHVHLHSIFVNKLIRRLEKNLDIMHLHTPICQMPDTELPLILTVHTPLLVDSRLVERLDPYSISLKIFTRFFFATERKLMQTVNPITTLTKSTSEQLREYGLNPEHIYVLGSGVDNVLFRIKRNTLHSSETYILYTGRLTYRKGLFDLLESAKYVTKERPEVYYVLSGKGPLLSPLMHKAKKLGLGGSFRFLGHVPRSALLNYYKNATVFILPSYQEGLPISLLEAMACGLPVVVTRIGAFLEIIEDRVTGIVVPPRSPKELANATLLLLNDPDLRYKLGHSARRLVRREFNWDAVAERAVRCYELALNQRVD